MRRAQQALARPQVSAEEYDEDYYRSRCAGHEEWAESGGAAEAGIFRAAIERSGMLPGMTVCDIGAGRGELVALAAENGARWAIGVEYAMPAAMLARETISRRDVAGRVVVPLADARRLPLRDASVDRIFMLDVIEHLAPDELLDTLREAHRVLRPGGRLFGHTFPTSTIYDVTYRAMRVAWRVTGSSWPADPRNDYEHRMHINEQTRTRLRIAMWRAGFRGADVHFGEWLHVEFVPTPKARAAYAKLARHRLTAPFAVADLWVEATR